MCGCVLELNTGKFVLNQPDMCNYFLFDTENTSKMLIPTKYAGKAISENAQFVTTRKLVNGLKTPTTNGQRNSVCGLRQAFLIVGTAARASLKIAKTIATLGFSVTYHKTKAKADKAPQA